MDELVLELEEIAYALDPEMYQQRLESDSHGGTPGQAEDQLSTAATEYRFAHYLLSRAADAETVPKNLRNLIKLVHERSLKKEESLSEQIKNAAATFNIAVEWTASKPAPEIKKLWLFSLVLEELFQNQQMHGKGRPCRIHFRPMASAVQEHWQLCGLTVAGMGEPELMVHFALDAKDGENRERLRTVMATHLQKPIPSREDRKVPSHGTGLYLANLAAALMRHRLFLTAVTKDEVTFCLFELANRAGDGT
jgi:hypothetical protein